MVENLFGDIIKVVQTFITKFFKGIYSRIYAMAASQLMPELNEPSTENKA